ncbi:MAG: bifunctional folylpolyglutamate synthase/dihydrofolate synthase [Spirochaetes bacterium]|nr:MAG: bifunctional folylpolyglutamate synthase/dihydrofolate synthase [Spirochaetota bacterium]
MIHLTTETTFTIVDEAFGYIESFTNLEKPTPPHVRVRKMERMRFLLDLFGNPHKHFKSIHIAGSKGKGSTGIFLSSILSALGYKTGLYTSPHVSSYKERITIAGEEIEDSLFISLISAIREKLQPLGPQDFAGGEGPTTFELLTLLAFLAFRELKCEWAVIETGIGGRLDATNVISPELCVLTPVEKEHTDLLGKTLKEIATEKGGIIKKGVPVYCGYQFSQVSRIFSKIAQKVGAEITFLADQVQDIKKLLSPRGSEVEIIWKSGVSLSAHLSLAGDFQAENATLAALIALSFSPFQNKCTSIEMEMAIKQGLKKAWIPGRMELVREEPPVIIDGAHTPGSISRLVDSFKKIFPRRGILIFGSVLGKDVEAMAKVLSPSFDRIIISTPGTFKKSDPQKTFEIFSSKNQGTILELSPRKAFDLALELSEGETPILVTGSFYMEAEIKKLLL